MHALWVLHYKQLKNYGLLLFMLTSKLFNNIFNIFKFGLWILIKCSCYHWIFLQDKMRHWPLLANNKLALICCLSSLSFFIENQYPDEAKREEIANACNSVIQKPGEKSLPVSFEHSPVLCYCLMVMAPYRLAWTNKNEIITCGEILFQDANFLSLRESLRWKCTTGSPIAGRRWRDVPTLVRCHDMINKIVCITVVIKHITNYMKK